MASLELVTNLKLINGVARTTPPSTTELPLGYMCFGVVAGKASVWGNYNNSVVDLVKEGQIQVEIVQVTGQSTTAVISQKGTTDNIATAKQEVIDMLGTAASKDVGTAAGNVPVLDTNGKLVESILPAIAIVDTFVVANQAAMLALNAQKGDVAIRTDINKSFILQSTPASTLVNWQELRTPTDNVLSVNGKTGMVVLTGTDITSSFTAATTRTNVATGETLATSLSKIMKWFADLKGLAFKDSIIATTDVTGILPTANLPKAGVGEQGIANFPAGSGLTVVDGEVSINAGTGIRHAANGSIEADVVLKIATI